MTGIESSSDLQTKTFICSRAQTNKTKRRGGTRHGPTATCQDRTGLDSRNPTVTAQLPFLPCQSLGVPPALPGHPGQKRPATNPSGQCWARAHFHSFNRKKILSSKRLCLSSRTHQIRLQSPNRNQEGSSFAWGKKCKNTWLEKICIQLDTLNNG